MNRIDFNAAVRRTVAWWTANSFGNYAERAETLTAMGLGAPSERQVTVFADRLTDMLENTFGKGRAENQLQTGHKGVSQMLALACKYSGLSELYLPDDSYTWINSECLVNGQLGLEGNNFIM